MRNAAPMGGASDDQAGWQDQAKITAPHFEMQRAAARAIEAGLICLPDACDLAMILRSRLDKPQRLWLAASSLMALPPDTAEALGEAVLADLRAWRHGPIEAEAERMRQRWIAHCSDPRRRARRCT